MSVRRLWVLVNNLPQDSAVARALHGEAAEWRVGDYLLAVAINDARQRAAGKQLHESKLIIPPGAKAQHRRPAQKQLGAAELDALFTGGG
jgi:hypothetical protein